VSECAEPFCLNFADLRVTLVNLADEIISDHAICRSCAARRGFPVAAGSHWPAERRTLAQDREEGCK
jgi:hypothetical protein